MKLLIIFLIFGSFSQPLLAKKLYKFKDKQGVWHFSDHKPQTKQPVEIRQLKAAHKRFIWLQKTGDKREPEFFIINNYKAPVEVEFKLTHNTNARINLLRRTKKLVPIIGSSKRRFTLQPGRSKSLFKVIPINKYKSSRYTIEYRYIIGSPSVSPDDVTYLPPFAKDSHFLISQAFGGKFSHTDKQNKYAVDLAMPINTPIHAARAGIVIEVNNDFFQSGTKQAYKARANSIRILHNDGTMAVYAHLALESSQVYVGLKVYAGQFIGYSGNTGYSTGPHLHFAIQRNKGMELVSIPFKFMGSADKPIAGTHLSN